MAAKAKRRRFGARKRAASAASANVPASAGAASANAATGATGAATAAAQPVSVAFAGGATASSDAAGNSASAAAAPAKRKSWLRRHGATLVLVLILLVGLGFLLYPTFSDWWNQYHQSRAIMDYTQTVSDMSDEQAAQMIADAEAYNAKLAQTGERWQMSSAEEQEYNSLLNVDGTGVMGYIAIPKIDVRLPVYHGTDDAVLQTSIGHISATSLPVGGASTHTVLSGHRGLPSARLFSDLDKLTEGDTFTITVLKETLTYQVDQIRIVEPDDISDLQIENGKDYCTLVTCTPYGINTQRLLVRAHRIPNANGDAQVIAEAIQIRPVYIAVLIGGVALAVLLAYTLISTWLRGRKPDVAAAYLATCGLERPHVDEPWVTEAEDEAEAEVTSANGRNGRDDREEGSRER